MTINEKFDNDAGRVGARMMEQARNRRKNHSIEEARSDYFTIFQMYCEKSVCDRLNRLKAKLASKNLMFKFDGSKYAIFHSDISDRTQITDYTLSLEEAEDFAEKV